jgi:hypothetical protein
MDVEREKAAESAVTKETGALLTALNNLDGVMVEVMLGLLQDTLSADEQVRFGGMFSDVGRLLEQRAEGMRLAASKQAEVSDSNRQT